MNQDSEHLADLEAAEAISLKERSSTITLTTETSHNVPVVERLGIVAAKVVFGMHIFRDIRAAFRDVFGGRSGTVRNGLKDLRETPLKELKVEPAKLGADAVLSVTCH